MTLKHIHSRMAQVQNEQQKMAVVPTTGVRLVSGALAGCFADLLTFPLDMAKVRLQVSHSKSSTNNLSEKLLQNLILKSI